MITATKHSTYTQYIQGRLCRIRGYWESGDPDAGIPPFFFFASIEDVETGRFWDETEIDNACFEDPTRMMDNVACEIAITDYQQWHLEYAEPAYHWDGECEHG